MDEEGTSVHRARVSWDADEGDIRAHERCFIANSVSCPVVVEPQP